jgi:glyoxylase-like metal-dependent hydrolase (beta-lactamase superfamily II)
MIRIDNVVTKAISKLGGSYDYSVCYLVGNSLLIDTGFPWARRSMQKNFLKLGLTDTLKVTVNTHSHEDHVGNNDLLLEITTSKIFAHLSGIYSIKYPTHLPWYRNFMFGPPPSSKVEPIPDIIEAEGYRFDVIHTPGHSPDHICLYEPDKRWLFSGDLYISADLDSQLREVDGHAWIKSLEKVIALKPQWMFDAHGVVVSGEDNVRDVLNEKLQFLIALRDTIFTVAETSSSENEIIEKVFNEHNFVNLLSFNEGWLSLLTCTDFSRRNVVQSFLKNKHDQV